MKRTCLCIALFVLSAWVASAGQLIKVVNIHRANFAPKLTGTLTSVGWLYATVFTTFHTVTPQPGQKPSERTSAYVMYDDSNIYVGLRLYDRKPDSIRADAVTRDAIDKDDWAAVCFDPSENHLQAVYFQVNPKGLQSDGRFDANGHRIPGAPTTWTAVAKRVPGGWVAELSIPFSSIGVQLKKQIFVGFRVIRHFGRNDELVEGPEKLIGAPSSLANIQQIRFAPAN